MWFLLGVKKEEIVGYMSVTDSNSMYHNMKVGFLSFFVLLFFPPNQYQKPDPGFIIF